MTRGETSNETLSPTRRALLRTIGATSLTGLAGCTESPLGSDDEGEPLNWFVPASAESTAALVDVADEIKRLIEEHAGYRINIERIEGADEERANIDIAERIKSDGEFDFAMIRNDIAYFAATGTELEEFESEPVESVRGVATLYPEGVHITTRPDADIQSIEDLEGVTIDTGALGSAKRANAIRILNSVGISPDDFTERNDDSTETSERSLEFAQTDGGPFTGGTDAAFVIGEWPIEQVEELLEAGDANLLSLDQDSRSTITRENEWLTENTIQAGTYNGVEEDVHIVSIQIMITTVEDIDEEVVGGVTTAIFENTEQIETKGEYISSETAMEGMAIEPDPAAEASLEEVDSDESEETAESADNDTGSTEDGGADGSEPAEDGGTGEPGDDNTESTEDDGSGGSEPTEDGGTGEPADDNTESTEDNGSGGSEPTEDGGTNGSQPADDGGAGGPADNESEGSGTDESEDDSATSEGDSGDANESETRLRY